MSKRKTERTKLTAKPKEQPPVSFYSFVWASKVNRRYLLSGIAIGIIYLLFLRALFPTPSYFFDSYTYIQAARDKVIASFRPTGYSSFINFFHYFSRSDIALIAAQYMLNVLANLFAFFTFLYFFPLPKAAKAILFVLLMCNPLYVFYSNYILSDAFFCALTVIWFSLLIWIVRKPSWIFIAAQLVTLLLLFKLRYNAIIYPFVLLLALVLSRKGWVKSLTLFALNGVLLFVLIQNGKNLTETATGERVFAPFSGWQLANNAIHVLKYEPLDTANLSEDETHIYRLVKNYMDTLTVKNNRAEAVYMWDSQSPLKQYVPVFAQKYGYGAYFLAWTALGPVYSTFGRKVILQKPFAYVQFFIWPNIKQYYQPHMEAYEQFNMNVDSINTVAREYYKYPNEKISLKNAHVSNTVFQVSKSVFQALNYMFLGLLVVYLLLKAYAAGSRFFNTVLTGFTLFYFCNLFFISAVAPNVFRYHVFVITLLCIVCTYLINNIVTYLQNRNPARRIQPINQANELINERAIK